MLGFFRKFLTSWPVLALLGLVLVAFVITGVGDPFGGGVGKAGSLARVGSTSIGENQFLSQFDRIVTRARDAQPGVTRQEIAKQGGVQQVLDQMIGGAALDDFAAAHGIVASERAVDGSIASIGAFQLAGKFDEPTYRRLLAERRLTERELRDGLRSDIIRRQLLVPVAAAAQVPRTLAQPYARLLLDVHEGAGGLVPPPVLAAPSDAAVAAYYAANAKAFTTPERRAFRYAIIDRDALAAGVAVSAADVAAEYAKNRDSYGGVERRDLAQVVAPDEAKARAIVAAARSGESFASVAKRLAGAAPADIALGAQTRASFASATSPSLADAVFAAAPGAIVGPVKTDFGWNVVAVVKVIAAQGKSVAAMTPEITAKLRTARGETALSEAVGVIEDGFASGKSFADLAAQYKLTPVSVPPVAKDGAGAPPAALPVIAKVFDLDPADGPGVQEVAKGQFALVELGDIVAPAVPPLAAVRPAVVAAVAVSQRAAAAKATADAVIAETAKGATFAAALAKRGLAAPEPLKGRRIDLAQAKQVPPPLARFLTMAAGQTVAMPARDGTVVLLHVDRIIPGDLASAPPLLDASRQQLAQLAPDEIAAAFGHAVERATKVRIDQKAVAALTRRIAGEGSAAAP